MVPWHPLHIKSIQLFSLLVFVSLPAEVESQVTAFPLWSLRVKYNTFVVTMFTDVSLGICESSFGSFHPLIAMKGLLLVYYASGLSQVNLYLGLFASSYMGVCLPLPWFNCGRVGYMRFVSFIVRCFSSISRFGSFKVKKRQWNI